MGPNSMGPNSMGPNSMGPNSMGPNSMGPNAMGLNAMGGNAMAPANLGPNSMGHNNMGPGTMVPGSMSNMQQQSMMGQHMPRKPGDAMMMNNPMFQGPRQMAPNQFLHQSPSPSAPSPAGVGSSGNQMVASPALVPSPSSQMSHMPQQRSVGMAPSPSSSLNTPGQAVPTASPLAVQQEEQAYREKARQLSKYIEPLRRMIARIGNDDVEKLSKFKKLLEILSNPTQRIPLETLLKCEVVLEKMDLKRNEGGSAPAIHPHLSSLKEHHIFNPLLEAVSSVLQSPTANHTLYRTFGPTMSSLSGPEIKNTSSAMKRSYPEDSPIDISDVLQGEIARLDQRFKVSLDPTHQPGSRSIQLLCCLDDKFLPSVPPVSLHVPEDYPETSPQLSMAEHEYGMTAFLSAVQKALQIRITKLPRRFSISQLLDTWEMSVRQACAPSQITPSTATVLLGL
uniref:Putative positive cofactor 2 pc2 subunit of a multiprotein coactivator of rna polymerase ii n=1 Tax=Xenopsylla cheopis TaxID=163159 RepID=A0A6M2DN10_XENCH